MCLNDANQPTASLELKKLSGSQKPQIAHWIEKLDTVLNQANASQNSLQMIDNINNDLQPFACIMIKRFDSTQKINLAIISEKRILKKCREETTQNKADKLLTSLQRDNQSRRQAKNIELSWNLTFTKLFCNRDSTRFTSKYKFKHFKDIKIYHI